MREINVYGFSKYSTKSNLVQQEPYLITAPTGSASWYSPDYYITTGSTWYYDYEFSKTAGNQFYIGIDRFASSGSTSNNSCVYQVSDKNNTYSHRRVKGTINLNAAISTGPVVRIRFRILSNWTNTTTASSAEVYRISLKEVLPGENIKEAISFSKTGIISAVNFIEQDNQIIPEKYGDLLAGSFVEY